MPGILRKSAVIITSQLILTSVQAAAPGVVRPDVATIAYACGGCHTTSGRSIGATPVITGMPEANFIRLMREFKSGERVSSIMNRIAQGYTDDDFVRLARFFRHSE